MISIIGGLRYGSTFALLCFPDLIDEEDFLFHLCSLMTSAVSYAVLHPTAALGGGSKNLRYL